MIKARMAVDVASTGMAEAISTAELSTSLSVNHKMTTGRGWFTGKDGIKLLERWWLPEVPKAAVAIIHGYAEHSGRYSHVAESFVAHGYAVYSYDHRAHGESEGKDTFIESFNDLLVDMDHFLEHIRSKVGELPFFLLGHSMGGLITARYVSSRQPTLQGLILSGPYIAIRDDIPDWVVSASHLIGSVVPKLPTLRLDYKHVSRDSEIMALHRADQLIYRGRIPARTGSELNQAVRQFGSEMDKIAPPLLIVHGSVDQIAPVQGSKRLYEQASNADKEIRIYDGLFHEVLNEVEREEVISDIAEWMNNRYDR